MFKINHVLPGDIASSAAFGQLCYQSQILKPPIHCDEQSEEAISNKDNHSHRQEWYQAKMLDTAVKALQ